MRDIEPRFVREAVLTYLNSGVELPGPLHDAAHVARFFRQVIPDGPVERLVVLVVNVKNRPVAWSTVGVGGLVGTTADIPAILRFILISAGSAFVLCHNHPSGDPTPSKDDHALTRRVASAAKLCDLRMLDHVIITTDSHWSFLDNNQLSGERDEQP